MDPENPAKLVTIPQIVSKDEDMVFLTVPEVELLVRFLAYTGVRINEVLTLQIQDLDFRNRKACIRRTWSDDGEGRMQLGTQKTVRRGPSPCRSLSFPNWRSRPPDKARTSSCSEPNAADASTTRAGGHASGIPACATRAWRARL